MALFHSPRIVTDGLILCLDAANPRSYPGTGNTWFDLSGISNNADLNDGAAFLENNIEFDGVDDGVDLNRSYFETVDEFSVLAWFKPDGVKGGAQMIFYEGQGDGFGSNDEFHVHYDGSSKQVSAWMTGGISMGSGSNSVDINKYSHVCYTVTGLNTSATAKLYLNGKLITTDTGTITRTQYGVNSLIGRPFSLSFPTPPRSFAGVIQNACIYNRVLSLEEVQQNFNALRGRFRL